MINSFCTVSKCRGPNGQSINTQLQRSSQFRLPSGSIHNHLCAPSVEFFPKVLPLQRQLNVPVLGSPSPSSLLLGRGLGKRRLLLLLLLLLLRGGMRGREGWRDAGELRSGVVAAAWDVERDRGALDSDEPRINSCAQLCMGRKEIYTHEVL